jgi:hypothetical protein
MLNRRVITPDGLTVEPGGVAIDIRLPWYRALPLSTVRIGPLSIDGVPIPDDRITFALGGHTCTLADLADLTSVFWFVTDSAILHVSAEPIAPGTTHEVDLTVTLHPPYIPGLVWPAPCHRSMVAKPAIVTV